MTAMHCGYNQSFSRKTCSSSTQTMEIVKENLLIIYTGNKNWQVNLSRKNCSCRWDLTIASLRIKNLDTDTEKSETTGTYINPLRRMQNIPLVRTPYQGKDLKDLTPISDTHSTQAQTPSACSRDTACGQRVRSFPRILKVTFRSKLASSQANWLDIDF